MEYVLQVVKYLANLQEDERFILLMGCIILIAVVWYKFYVRGCKSLTESYSNNHLLTMLGRDTPQYPIDIYHSSGLYRKNGLKINSRDDYNEAYFVLSAKTMSERIFRGCFGMISDMNYIVDNKGVKYLITKTNPRKLKIGSSIMPDLYKIAKETNLFTIKENNE